MGMMFDKRKMEDIQIVIDRDMIFILWNNEEIQGIAEELGEPEFPESRPCG